MGEVIKDITMHVQHTGLDGPSTEDFADAFAEEYGFEPMHITGAYDVSSEEQRSDRIAGILDRIAFGGLGMGALTVAVSLVAYTSERPDVGGTMLVFGLGSMVMGFATTHLRDYYENTFSIAHHTNSYL